jgi:hypothetical protein
MARRRWTVSVAHAEGFRCTVLLCSDAFEGGMCTSGGDRPSRCTGQGLSNEPVGHVRDLARSPVGPYVDGHANSPHEARVTGLETDRDAAAAGAGEATGNRPGMSPAPEFVASSPGPAASGGAVLVEHGRDPAFGGLGAFREQVGSLAPPFLNCNSPVPTSRIMQPSSFASAGSHLRQAFSFSRFFGLTASSGNTPSIPALPPLAGGVPEPEVSSHLGRRHPFDPQPVGFHEFGNDLFACVRSCSRRATTSWPRSVGRPEPIGGGPRPGSQVTWCVDSGRRRRTSPGAPNGNPMQSLGRSARGSTDPRWMTPTTPFSQAVEMAA